MASRQKNKYMYIFEWHIMYELIWWLDDDVKPIVNFPTEGAALYHLSKAIIFEWVSEAFLGSEANK